MNPLNSQPMPSLGPSLHNGIRKRRRKALSCYECRRRKVKCDRETPSCNRCKETGQAESCSYTLDGPERGNDDERSESPEEPVVGFQRRPYFSNPLSNVSDDIMSILKQQSRKIAQLEDRLALPDARPSREWKGLEQYVVGPRLSMAESSISKMQMYIEEQEPKEPETIPVRGGRGFETKFYGASNSTSLIAYFPELRSFIQESLQVNSSLARLQRGIHSHDDQQRRLKSLNSQPAISNEYLLTFLPRRESVDRLVKIYFENFENTYRILHESSFYDEYNTFWQDPQNGLAGFVAILLLVSAMATALSSDRLSKDVNHGSPTRDTWVSWIEACDKWLELQSQKHLNLANFQVRCLLLLSKQMTMVKEKRAWTSATTLLSFSMSAGLHRDPSLLSGRISTFEQEMRRRLWGTIVELEIEASIDRGVKPFSTDLPYDCASPSNLNDSEFGIGSEQLPKEKPSLTFTTTSFLCKLHVSRSYRTALVSLINNPKSNLSYDELMNHEGRILQMAKEVSSWEDVGGSHSTHSRIPHVLIDIQLRQLLLLLHSPWARRADLNPRYSYSRMICINTAKHILDQYSALTSSGSYALLLIRNDVVRAALSFCHNFFISRSIRDDLSSLILGYSVFPLLDNALLLLEDKITRIERGYKNYIFISTAYGLILSQDCPEQSEKYKSEAIERVTRLYTKIFTITGGVDTRPNGPMQPPAVGVGIVTPESPYLMSHSNNTIEVSDMPFEPFDFGDMSDWPLDNLWQLEFEATNNMAW